MARLITLAGLPGVGKSSIARDLARRTGAIWLRIDSMDQAMWASGTAPNDLLDWTYRAAQAVAVDNLVLGLDVIADCVNDCEEAREGWENAARKANAKIVWLEVVCSDTEEHKPWNPMKLRYNIRVKVFRIAFGIGLGSASAPFANNHKLPRRVWSYSNAFSNSASALVNGSSCAGCCPSPSVRFRRASDDGATDHPLAHPRHPA